MIRIIGVLIVVVYFYLLMAVLVIVENPRISISDGTIAPSPTQTETPQMQGIQLPAPGRVAPDFTLTNLDGESVSLRDYRGNPVLLNFWATWCGPCRFEMPFIQEVYEDPDWQATGLVILAVNIGESRAEAEGFMKNNGLTFPVLLDSSSSVGRTYNIRSIPTTLFIDKDGIIQHIDIGAFPSSRGIEERLTELVFGEE